MRRLVLAPVLAAALALAGCATGQTWQVVGVYTDPSLPGALTPDAAGRANVTVRGDTFEGTTGCAEVEGSFEETEEQVAMREVAVGQLGACTGGVRRTHDQLAGLFVEGAEFSVRRLSEYEVLLTSTADALDPPSVRLMLL